MVCDRSSEFCDAMFDRSMTDVTVLHLNNCDQLLPMCDLRGDV